MVDEFSVFVDYLLKPFGFDRFLQAVNKVIEDKKLKSNSSKVPTTHLFVKAEHRLENIEIAKILYIEGMREYLRIVTTEQKVMTKMSFLKILSLLPENQFIQVHKSWVVQTNKIERIERNRIFIGEKLIPIGNTFKEHLRTIL